MKLNCARLVLLAFLAVFFAWPAASVSAQNTVWPTYHYNSPRQGVNSNSTDLNNPASLGLVWAFPRGAGAKDLPEGDSVVDNSDTRGFFESIGFRTGLDATNQYGDDFLYKTVISREERDADNNPKPADARATWYFPSTLPAGTYQIMVWVPTEYPSSNYRNTTQAEYTVYDDSGATTIRFNQRNGGGWHLLTTRYFSFAAAKNYRVELTNLTDDSYASIVDDPDSKDPKKVVIVAADAIRFVAGTGMEIYASPASAEIDWTVNWTYHDTINDPPPPGGNPDRSGTFTGKIPVVYIGTVEPPASNASDSPDTGSIYCVNSITAYSRKITDPTWRDGPTSDYDEWARANGLAKYLGTDIWRYPRKPADRYSNPATANELEGPIEGGIYASPTVVPTGRADHPLVCYVAAMDRQLYALDAETGELLWKGPGMTASEGSPAGWDPVTVEDFGGGVYGGDSFGGICHATTAADPANAGEIRKVEWRFDDNDRKLAGEPVTDGWSYSVYAWIPGPVSATADRVTDALYTITYENAAGSKVDAEVKLDQSDTANHGRWVKLGSSYFNVSKVTLSNATTVHKSNASSFKVVADAVMIVPDSIDAFSYSTPVWNEEGDPAGRIFVAGTSGRILSFSLMQNGNPALRAGTVKFIYPAVRTSRRITGQADMDKPGLGPISASLAYRQVDGKRLFAASFDGKVYCINVDSDTPSLNWEFPEGEDEDPERFTSSPAVDYKHPQLFIGGTFGNFYCLNTSTGQINWKYPADPVPGGFAKPPLGAFRYSTAAVGDDSGGMHRVWVGSTDGRLYSFYADEPNNATAERRIYVEFDDNGQAITPPHVRYYVEPGAGGPIQGSIAIDGKNASKQPVMYVGDMRDRGALSWFRADNGVSDFYVTRDGKYKYYKSYRLEGQVFSSPNITHTTVETTGKAVSYVYVGCSDGRLYAFSDEDGAWGGGWAGGEWPFTGSEPDGEDRKEEMLAPDTDIQFEMITKAFFEKTNAAKDFENTVTVGSTKYYTMPATWDDDWLVSKEMKQPSKDLTAAATDKEIIDDELRTQAKARRAAKDALNNDAVFALQDRLRSGSDPLSTVYFEWGEKIYLALWNLPEKAFIQSGSGGISFSMTNTGPGAGSGSAVRPQTRVASWQDYTVLSNTKKPGDPNTTPPTPEHYDPLYYPEAVGTNQPVRRSFAVAELDFSATGQRPPSPGPGWVLSAQITKKSSTSSTASTTTIIIPIAKLVRKGTAPEPVFLKYQTATPGTVGSFKEQDIGVNNPLAIRDDNPASVSGLAWPTANYSCLNQRNNPEAHFNGNASVDSTTGYRRSKLPVLNLDIFRGTADLGVAHGTTSREARLGIMDRSAMGLAKRRIDNFRVEAEDLRWRGGVDAVTESYKIMGAGYGVMFPWELGLGSVDYPNIPRKRQRMRKALDERDPSRGQSSLPPVIPSAAGDYDSATMQPDTLFVSVEVPKYQPANTHGEGLRDSFGYSDTMTAYVDSDGNGAFTSGDSYAGRPATYQEAYRRFRTGLRVPPDPKVQVEEQLVDIGQAAHGLGVGLDFIPINFEPGVRQWFRKITIKNDGNVNLYNLRVAKNVPLFMVKDAASLLTSAAPVQQIPGKQISSSFDPILPSTPFLRPLKADPFTFSGVYTLTKPRVGDPDPAVLTIPDKRKWDMDYQDTQASAAARLEAAIRAYDPSLTPAQVSAKAKSLLPYPAEVSVSIPISQPTGTYQAPFVPVFCDMNGDGLLTVDSMTGLALEPMASPTFQLKVTVREAVITGDRQPGSLPQIDLPASDGRGGEFFPRVGDSTPAAYRDAATGNVRLWWSSNRMFDPSLYPDWTDPNDPRRADFANAPWLLNQAELVWVPNNDPSLARWANAGSRWWALPSAQSAAYVPQFGANAQWPGLLPVWSSTAYVMPWEMGGSPTGFQSVRHYAPSIAENTSVDPKAAAGRTYLAWAGAANVLDGAKSAQETALFYTDVSTGLIDNSKADIRRLARDPFAEKRHPSLSVFRLPSGGDRMWMFWQGADADRWSIYYAVNDRAGFSADGWDRSSSTQGSLKLRTPDCLATAGSPNAVHRVLGDTAAGASGKHLFDVIYDGSTKLGQTSDLLLTRCAALSEGDVTDLRRAGTPVSTQILPSRGAQPMPRIFGEKLRRDARYGFFTSVHLAWIRPSRQSYDKLDALVASGDISAAQADDIIADHFGRQEHEQFTLRYDGLLNSVPGSRSGLYEFYNAPCIKVVLPDALPQKYTDLGLNPGDEVSATHGVIPEYDDATGILSYKYKESDIRYQLFGETIADYSAGIIRFKNPLAEMKKGDGTVAVPEVFADYTPQTWRLTTDPAVDNSPSAFIERTGMNKQANPGMSDWPSSSPPPSVDRLWVLWRKAGTGLTSSTIFWKTYRIGVDLSALKDSSGRPLPPVKWNVPSDGSLPSIGKGDVTVSNALGAWEVDRTGYRIYFTEIDERYSSLIQTAGRDYFFANNPAFLADSNSDGVPEIKPIVIKYTARDPNDFSKNITVEAVVKDVSWIEEAGERSLLGYSADSSVNEGSIYGFADIGDPTPSGTISAFLSPKIWVFWTSTRGGTSDVCWATLSPSFTAR